MHQPLRQHPAVYRNNTITVCRATPPAPVRRARRLRSAYPPLRYLTGTYQPTPTHPPRRHAGTPPSGRPRGRRRTAPLVFAPPTAEDMAYQAFLQQLCAPPAVGA